MSEEKLEETDVLIEGVLNRIEEIMIELEDLSTELRDLKKILGEKK